ncbi:MAG: hypothetical protein GXP16_15600, partial [Gammaproteobacteria bacterium]|nr:hypothetical protein [Gammaproteobacteria bacterium]
MADYYHINNEISDTSSFQDITKKILSPLAQLVGGETSLFVMLKKTDNGMRAYNLISSSIDYEASLSYVENFQSSDPALPYVFNAAKVNYKRGISKSISVALENIIDFKKFSRGKYYNEFLRPNSIRHLMVVGIPSVTDNSLVYALGFHRYSNNAFKKADARISSYFGPMLSNALHNLELKTQLSDHNIIVSYLKKQIYNMGLVILDNNLEVIFASSAGQKHLQINHDSG